MNISTTLVELALSMFSHWSKEKDEVLALARGGYAPYRIRNRTGSPINIWGDAEGVNKQEVAPTRIQDNEIIDWRFDDWKTMREVGIPLIGSRRVFPHGSSTACHIRWEPQYLCSVRRTKLGAAA